MAEINDSLTHTDDEVGSVSRTGSGPRPAQRLKNVLLWIALIGIVMLPRVLNLDTFIGPDEKILWGWGNHFALALSQGDWRETLTGDGYPAVTLMWVNTLGVALKWLWLHVMARAGRSPR